ncbi:hypothetical protein SARC_05068 [Sphaeroforma arctica JP610]|uniref:Uncharacterized protein n=1 Tax=Sphaeroforma arctica JP610 TaxID=667725 RepID=A0A0L0G0L6_9EUKA|nr:hypothetical protein SARC_05068 [Sphaeroforma arctica JP610]KNC82647.1 hypothetical protein SARC_05068 [Sphaeroforma arctica JP610]|eukprot:XP_014156549.1 hypothetical protein SARC_05068 [Sphaeroforma arctica JP610]
MLTSTRAGVYGGGEGGEGADDVGANPGGGGGGASPGSGSGQPTPAGVPIVSSMRLEIDKSICQGNYVLVSRFVSKLEQTVPVPIPTLHKMRVGIHDQQPERRIPLVDAELRRRYDLAINDCGDDKEDDLIQISQYISELELIRSQLGDQINKPPLAKLLKTSEFPKMPKDSYFRMENCEDIIKFTIQCSNLFLAKSMPLCQYPALVRNLIDSTDATEKTKSVLKNLRDSETHETKHFKEPVQFNRIIIDRLMPYPVDCLLKKFLNDMQNKKLNVEVRIERARKAKAMLEKRYRNSDKTRIHFQLLKVQRYQALKYYGQQTLVDILIKGDKRPFGSEGYLSVMEHTKFHTMTESHIRMAAVLQGEPVQAENSTTNANKRYKPDNGAPNQNKPVGQAQEKKEAREERPCPYCLVMPAPHRYSKCPNNNKKVNEAKQAEERAKKDVQIARLSITSGKVEEITEGAEH